jgi:hypothetical protein
MKPARMLAFTMTVAVLALFAYQHRVSLPSVPDPTTLIINARNHVQPFHYALSTNPEDPSCDRPTILVVHAVDAAGQPIDGLNIEASVSMALANQTAQQVKLRSRGHGNYEGRVNLEMAGTWDVDLAGEKDGNRARQRLSVEVGPAHGPTPIDDDDDDDS